jgi:hypothetical protein
MGYRIRTANKKVKKIEKCLTKKCKKEMNVGRNEAEVFGKKVGENLPKGSACGKYFKCMSKFEFNKKKDGYPVKWVISKDAFCPAREKCTKQMIGIMKTFTRKHKKSMDDFKKCGVKKCLDLL